MHHVWGSATNLRDFVAARRTAASLHKRGWPGRQIGRYLATYGYVNKKGIVGAWHHKRLSEALSGGLHV